MCVHAQWQHRRHGHWRWLAWRVDGAELMWAWVDVSQRGMRVAPQHSTQDIGGTWRWLATADRVSATVEVRSVDSPACDMELDDLETPVSDRSSWRELCKDGIAIFELRRVDTVKEKRRLRKAGSKMTTGGFRCDLCGRTCACIIGLFSHRRVYLWQRDPSSPTTAAMTPP